MKYNLEHFSEIMDQQLTDETKELLQKSNDLYLKLTSNMEKNIASDEIQQTVHEIVNLTQDKMLNTTAKTDYWDMIIETYSKDFVKAVTDTEYGTGASDYIAQALYYYFHK